MLNINFENLEKIDERHGLSNEEIASKSAQIAHYLEKIQARNRAFYNVFDDADLITEIKEYGDSVKGKFESVVVLGIGGSALGTICLERSLKHIFGNEKPDKTNPKLYVLDNIDPNLIREIDDVINYEKTLFIVISKSGKTPETIAQYFYFRDKTDKKGLDPSKNFVFVTGMENSFLRKIGEKENIKMFEIPKNISGRFSVLSAVGLVPAYLIGINIDQLIEGAKYMRDKFLSENFEENTPFKVAVMQYLLDKKGKCMNVIMPYSQKLIRFSDWYRQLLAESIGKAQNENGDTVNVGITPVSALGATDQHSQSQLYNEGPNNKFIIFIKVNDLGQEVEIPTLYPNEENFSFLQGVSFNKLMHTEQQGTTEAFTRNNRPNITLELEKVDEYHLGALFMLFEASTAFLGELYEINAFNQPGVELSKVITRELLS
ncbi:glucose-6-phosphate isomerase [Patescibacteria group bacterium]|nr:glucose-6-phosphate isomerase [Patescibacteria group bacterium]